MARCQRDNYLGPDMVDKNLPVQMHCFDLQIKITQYVEMKLNKIDVSF